LSNETAKQEWKDHDDRPLKVGQLYKMNPEVVAPTIQVVMSTGKVCVADSV
jgi:hypothetical protein